MKIPILAFIFFNFLYLVNGNKAFSQIHLSQTREKISLDNDWVFKKESDHLTKQVSIPHTWNIDDVMDDELGYYRGVGIYTKKIKTPTSWKGKEVYLCFDGANQETAIFLNGNKLGEHIGGYNQFRIRITNSLNWNIAENELMIKVDNHFNPDIPPLTADFTFFGGIYRKVYLLVVNPVHFSDEKYGSNGVYLSTPQVSDKEASVNIKGSIINHQDQKKKLKVVTTLYDALLKEKRQVSTDLEILPNETKSFFQSIANFQHPILWSPENPYQYKFETIVLDENNHQLDQLTNFFGFRWYRFDAETGFYLNGKSLKLIGASRHQDYKGMGNAVADSLQIKDVILLKDMGANFLRVAHYPQSQAVLDACDSLGILTSIEIPVVNQISETESFSQNAEHMQLEMIKQNFNHPSVIIWAYMNEVLLKLPFANDKNRQDLYLKHVAELAQKLENITSKEDSLRYTMISNHGSFELYERAGLLSIPQLIGWNLYQGWYGGKIADFATNLDQIHRKQPNKPFLVTEFGADADPRIRSLTPVKFDKSVEYALDYHQGYIKAITERPFVAGAAIWNLADFSSETREETMPHINNKGLLTWDRKRKDTYSFYQAYLLKQPFLKISNWTSRAGIADQDHMVITQQLMVFSNSESVSIRLNGKEWGSKEVKNNIATFDIPFKDGKNEVEAYDIRNGLSEVMTINFNLIPRDIKKYGLGDKTLSILLGAKRNFIDEEGLIWIADQKYKEGSWGSVGGTPYEIPKSNRQSYGTDRAIKNTAQNPIYQTQLVGINSYQLDVPKGVYELKLYFSEFLTDEMKEALAYNLDNSQQKMEVEKRIFNVAVNDKVVLKNFHIAKDFGPLTAVCKTFKVKAKRNNGIVISFTPIEGQPILNALQIKKL